MPSSPLPECPPEWKLGIDTVLALPIGGIALIVGGADTGKTTFVNHAARASVGSGKRTAVIDCDTGQSEIGPPGTVGVACATAHSARLHNLKPAMTFFVGAISPLPAALEHVTAAARAVRWARDAGTERLLIDTPGFISGPAARRFHAALAQAISPDLIVCLDRPGTENGISELAAFASGARLLHLPTSDLARAKSSAQRGLVRRTRLSAALECAEALRLPLALPSRAGVETVGARLGSGAPLPGHLARWVGSALRLPVVRAEIDESDLTVFVDGEGPLRRGWENDIGIVADHFKVRSVRPLRLATAVGAYVGLMTAGGNLAGVGRFEGLAGDTDEVLVFASIRGPVGDIRVLQFGRIRIGRDGVFGAEIRPGDM